MLHKMETRTRNERGKCSFKRVFRESLLSKKEGTLWTSGEGLFYAEAKHKAKAKALGSTTPANSRHSKQANILRNHKRRMDNKREIKLSKASRTNR